MIKNLKVLREQLQLNKKQMAEKLNIDERTYLNYENNKSEPKIETLIEIANYFNVSLDELCGRNFNTNNYPAISNQDKEAIKMFCELTENQKNFIYGEIKICYLQNH